MATTIAPSKKQRPTLTLSLSTSCRRLWTIDFTHSTLARGLSTSLHFPRSILACSLRTYRPSTNDYQLLPTCDLKLSSLSLYAFYFKLIKYDPKKS